MSRIQSDAQIVLSTKEVSVAGSVEVPGLKDNCTCSQGRYESSILEDARFQEIMISFEPQEIRTMSDFVALRNSVS